MKTYKLNDSNVDILKLQRHLNATLGMEMRPDGYFGKLTQSALEQYQTRFKIVERDETGAVYGPITQGHALPWIDLKYLKEKDYQDAAKDSGLDVNVIKAVTSVEALGFGFFNDGKPTILFERHVFYRELVKAKSATFANKIALTNPSVCNKTPGGYVGGSKETLRLDEAFRIDEGCALRSASYGLFQIMGFNHKQAGYRTVMDYYKAMCLGEKQQLDAFVKYVMLDRDQSLFTSLRIKDFTAFAREYNGPAFNKHKPPYDVRIQRAYNALSRIK
jgi:peptidoglycan hydrolase-like protein with peptidoglycan-binding domain